MLFPSDIPELVLFYVAAVAVAAFVHGTLGLGFPLLLTPMLSMFMDVRSAILISLLPTITVNLISITSVRNWKESIRQSWQLPCWVFVGGIVGAFLIVVNDPAPFKLLLALLVLLYLLIERSKGAVFGNLHRYPASANLGFGLAAGVSAGSTNTMVPILVIYALELSLTRDVMVPLYNFCFLIGKATQVGVFTASGVFTLKIALSTISLACVAAIALIFGKSLRDKITTDLYLKIIKSGLFVMALVLIAQFFWQL